MSANRPPPSTPTRKQQTQSQPKLPMSGVPFGHLPAFLPGSASLVEQLDRRIMIVLRDGRHLVGILRSFDQFSNMVMEETSERRVLHIKKGKDTICYYTDIKLGLYLVRGDSMVLLGELVEQNDGGNEGNEKDSDKEGEEEDKSASTKAKDGEELTGSGLLMSDAERQMEDQKKKLMKEVTLEEFEKLEEENMSDAVDDLTWEFDLDLVV
mmetsp:Transcript_5853/g.8705  ORF Transcript_5853/g.8705 Transcript_5853/m.8705 type:complete len:210 (+) Transcript_5853:143-772(+)|eukprot:CAMPEP_0197241334 /NCGR_PEP_ID=MMETSP1429-20130617/7396_1 /TAXON_ID=49237 /ORGANISM="Chaetoceros  sp., Strain UNC1202" /LENGTH=209 /DNA_ID=CAMNT_0042701151 /DNA_START=137 /DNA_END=766 /DNA_ORIENTATION=-